MLAISGSLSYQQAGVSRMADNDQAREDDLRQLLTDVIEVQLAALTAAITFWSEWIEQTSAYVQSASKSLSTITAEDQQAKDVLLELVDAGRASVRSMTEIPRHTATRFIEELDRLKEKQAKATPAPGGGSQGGAASRRKRSGRVKA